jgi:hypothetical protein
MNRGSPQQRGFALWALLFMITLGLGYSLYLTANANTKRHSRDTMLATTLLRAKDALLARAVNDQNRPGSLPCPDLITDAQAMNNHPGDGKADMLAGNQCPSYLGWLPWITLDLPEPTDAMGNHLWYALSPSLRDDDSAQPINVDTAMDLEVDGQSEIAAIIIAPGAPVGQQQRPSNRPADYLESTNEMNGKFVSGPPRADFNDTLITISRAEIMAAAGKRIAGELRSCLEQHADSTANPEHRYPWPAPLGPTNTQGKAGARFGRVATTQPNAGPEAALAASIERLKQAREQLAGGLDAQQQSEALKALNDSTIQIRQLFEAIYTASSKLKQSVDAATALLQGLSTTITAAAANGRISRSEGSAIRAFDATTQTALQHLPELLDEFGIDVLPEELARRSSALAGAQTVEELRTRVVALQELLSITHSQRTDLSTSLAAAVLAATAAHDAAEAAARNPTPALLMAANSTASDLLDSTNALGKASAASRVNLLAGEVDDYPELLEVLMSKLNDPARLAGQDLLLKGLTTTRRAVDSLRTGLNSIVAVRQASSEALATAILLAQSAQPNPVEIGTSTRQAIAQTRLLSTAIAANEAADNNLTHSSLLEAIRAYQAAERQFSSSDTAEPRPLQSAIIPDAEALGAATAKLDTWLRIIAANSSTLALLAKAEAASSEPAIATTSPLDQSAYTTASVTLDSISRSTGAVQTYLLRPNDDRRSTAQTAIAETLDQTGHLLDQARLLAENLKSSAASAFPMVWNTRNCAFLGAGQRGWWNDNRWSASLFYQISSPLQNAPGNLTVNGTGQYRLVVLASGPGLSGQRREIARVGNFLEGINASPTRDADASAPSPHFSGTAPSPGFNDRLAY